MFCDRSWRPVTVCQFMTCGWLSMVLHTYMNVCGIIILEWGILLPLLSPLYLCCLQVVAKRHKPSPLLATCYRSGVLDIVCTCLMDTGSGKCLPTRSSKEQTKTCMVTSNMWELLVPGASWNSSIFRTLHLVVFSQQKFKCTTRSLTSLSEVPQRVQDLHSMHCHLYFLTLSVNLPVNWRQEGWPKSNI